MKREFERSWIGKINEKKLKCYCEWRKDKMHRAELQWYIAGLWLFFIFMGIYIVYWGVVMSSSFFNKISLCLLGIIIIFAGIRGIVNLKNVKFG